ncbi:MAG TPA: preprotein translocase subunit SecG [Micavibrio sp.]
MIQVLLVIQLIVTISMIGLILLQRSEGGGLGIGGGGLGGLANPQSTASALTRATAICAAIFFIANMVLAVLAEGGSTSGSLADHLNKVQATQEAPASDAAKAEETAPSVPVAE